ncbi:MAG: hypothetical protein Q8K33_01665 [Cypionkella sp.]|uniref:hypothetical protein n=1 Tax=Cypionkella sp. TaxID=2811411 RepID=UPI00272FF158|nr:hypothetical protein [Cypionkella sp.]MDP2047589.1 hypothetical protein [Cypionkella sp.]
MKADQLRHARIDRLAKALEISAKCVEINPVYTPIFERLDAELAAELAGVSAVDRVRAMIRVRKMAAA